LFITTCIEKRYTWPLNQLKAKNAVRKSKTAEYQMHQKLYIYIYTAGLINLLVKKPVLWLAILQRK